MNGLADWAARKGMQAWRPGRLDSQEGYPAGKVRQARLPRMPGKARPPGSQADRIKLILLPVVYVQV